MSSRWSLSFSMGSACCGAAAVRSATTWFLRRRQEAPAHEALQLFHKYWSKLYDRVSGGTSGGRSAGVVLNSEAPTGKTASDVIPTLSSAGVKGGSLQSRYTLTITAPRDVARLLPTALPHSTAAREDQLRPPRAHRLTCFQLLLIPGRTGSVNKGPMDSTSCGRACADGLILAHVLDRFYDFGEWT